MYVCIHVSNGSWKLCREYFAIGHSRLELFCFKFVYYFYLKRNKRKVVKFIVFDRMIKQERRLIYVNMHACTYISLYEYVLYLIITSACIESSS